MNDHLYDRALLALVAVGLLGSTWAAAGCSQYTYSESWGPAPAAPIAETARDDANREGYDHVEDSPFVTVASQPLSTFAADVDTASYSNTRRMLEDGYLPPKGAVRAEEFINYFSYDYPAPDGDAPFSATTEVGPSPWADDRYLVHIGLAAPAIATDALPPRNLVFLLDISGSMTAPNKLGLLKRGLGLLVEQLTERDTVSIVVYAGASGLVLPPTSGDQRDRILEAITRLEAGGSTNGGEGIELAYAVAAENFQARGINRVILATDGDFNVGVSSESGLVDLIEEKRKSGVFLTVLGLGTGNYQDSRMEKLADHGNGNYAYLDTVAEARKVLVEEAGATLVTVAKDVKLQVEFNPTYVQSYRLIGYENRRLAAEDFEDDAKDAGDIGAGHTVTALYEIVPVGVDDPTRPAPALKYQTAGGPSDAAASGELLTVKVRYKRPAEATSQLMEVPVGAAPKAADSTSDDFRFSAAVAAFAMILRDSAPLNRGTANLAMVQALASGALADDRGGYRRQFLTLVEKAERLGAK